MTKYRVELTQGEREELLARVNRGSGRAAEIKRANLLPAVDQGGFADLRTADKETAMAYRSTVKTVHDLKRRLVEEGFDGVLARKAHGGPGNARTGGEAETLRWVSDDLFPEAGGSSWSGTIRARAPWGHPARRSRQERPSGSPPASRPVTHPGTFRAS